MLKTNVFFRCYFQVHLAHRTKPPTSGHGAFGGERARLVRVPCLLHGHRVLPILHHQRRHTRLFGLYQTEPSTTGAHGIATILQQQSSLGECPHQRSGGGGIVLPVVSPIVFLFVLPYV
jgi:hypothetical protein